MRFFGSAFAFAPTSIESFIMRSHTHIHRDTHTENSSRVINHAAVYEVR